MTVVLTDKTGTLTLNDLRVDVVRGGRRRVLTVANAAHGLAPDAVRDPLDAAMVAGVDGDVAFAGELMRRYPFDPG